MSIPRRLTGAAVLAVLVAGCGSRVDQATLQAANGLLPGTVEVLER